MATKTCTVGCPHVKSWISGSRFWCSVSNLERRCHLSFLLLRTRVSHPALRSVNTFSILTSQYFSPHGYSDDVSGFMGATLLLAGIVASAITSPLFDRVLTRHLGRTIQVLVPILSAAWLSMIWAGKLLHSCVLRTVSRPDTPSIQFVQITPYLCLSFPRS